jgi:hypothetical protein
MGKSDGKRLPISMHIDGRIILEGTLKKWGVWIGFIWLKIGTSDGLL